MQLIFEITWQCPAKCRFCTVPKADVQIPLSLYRRALRLFRGLDSEMSVVLSGGEPTTVPTLAEYVREAKRLGYTVTLVTNGFNPDAALGSGADLIEVSADYWGERHEESRGVKGLWASIERLLREGEGRVVIRSTLLSDNLQDILRMREAYPRIPILVMPVRGYADKPKPEHLAALSKLENVYVADNCPAGVSSFTIVPGLDPERELGVVACIFYRKPLGRLRRFTKAELDEVLGEGARLPRFPCERK